MLGINKNFLMAVTILSSTIIGAGIFSLPYVFRSVGFLSGIFYIIFFTCVYYAIHIMYASVIGAKEGDHQFFYYAREVFKRPFSEVVSWVILAELLFVLAIYLILVPVFSSLVFGGSGIIPLVVFWFLGSAFMFVRLGLVGGAELLGTISIVGVVALLFFVGILKGQAFSLTSQAPISLFVFLLPFGPILFSLSGRPAISKVLEEHKKSRAEGRLFSVKKSIFWGTAIPAFVYIVFVFSVLRLNPEITPETLNGLSFLSTPLLTLLGCLGLITIWTSYFMIAINIKDILVLDLGIKKIFAAAFVSIFPLALYFAGFKNFLASVSFVGSIFLALEGVFVVMMWRRVFPDHPKRWIAPILYSVFLLAIAHEVVKIFV